MAGDDQRLTPEAEKMRHLRHQVRNQLSAMLMSIEHLKIDLGTTDADLLFYLNTLNQGCQKIDQLLSEG